MYLIFIRGKMRRWDMNMKTKVDYLKKFSRVQLTNIFLASGSILPVPSTSSSSSSSSSFISSTVVSANAAAAAASAAASAAEAMRIAAKLSSSLSSLTPSQPSLSLQSSASTDDAQAPQPSAAFSYVTSIPSGRSSSSSTSSTAGPGSQPTTSTQRRNRWGPAQSSSSVSAAEPDIEQVVATFSSSDSSYDDEVQQPSLTTYL